MRKMPAVWLGLFILIALAPLSSISSAQDSREDFILTIYHTNDEHAHHRPNRDDIGGVARLMTVIEQARSQDGNMLLLDAGDRFSGTLFHYFYQGQDNVQVMNLLGYDAMTLGNHEFDNGSQVLADFIKGVNFPVLGANVDVTADPALLGLVQPYTVLEVGGESIGLIGIVTPRTATISQPEDTVQFLDTLAPLVNGHAQELLDQGINKIILLSHIGYNDDLALASQLVGIDVIVGGHTNTVPSPYPTSRIGADGQPILVVQAGSYSLYVGQLVVTFDAEGLITASDGKVLQLVSSIEEAPEMVTLLDELEQPLNEYTQKIIGQTAFAYRRDCYGQDCDLGALITDVMLEATGADIAIMNSGGIREALPSGDITYGDILSVLPFGNQLSIFELSGADVIATLEHGVSGEVNGKFPQVGGLRFTWNPAAPSGERIGAVELYDADTDTWTAIDPSAIYSVATNDFMRGGGDDYAILQERATNAYDGAGDLAELVASYITAHSPITNKAEGRIRIAR